MNTGLWEKNKRVIVAKVKSQNSSGKHWGTGLPPFQSGGHRCSATVSPPIPGSQGHAAALCNEKKLYLSAALATISQSRRSGLLAQWEMSHLHCVKAARPDSKQAQKACFSCPLKFDVRPNHITSHRVINNLLYSCKSAERGNFNLCRR